MSDKEAKTKQLTIDNNVRQLLNKTELMLDQLKTALHNDMIKPYCVKYRAKIKYVKPDSVLLVYKPFSCSITYNFEQDRYYQEGSNLDLLTTLNSTEDEIRTSFIPDTNVLINFLSYYIQNTPWKIYTLLRASFYEPEE